MSDARAKKAAKIQEAIRQILYHEWDPIGIRGWGPEDEYDSYIGPVYRILASSRSEQELIDYLYRIERNTIGLSCERPEQLQQVVRKLLLIDTTL